jgi:hypothetical protein
MSEVTRVYLAQVLCPKRHEIVGNAGEVTLKDGLLEELVEIAEKFRDQIQACAEGNPPADAPEQIHHMSALCGICGAPLEQWKVEVGLTGFSSLEEAMPHLIANHRAQLLSRAIIDYQKSNAENN